MERGDVQHRDGLTERLIRTRLKPDRGSTLISMAPPLVLGRSFAALGAASFRANVVTNVLEERRMLGRTAVLAALIALAGCAGIEPAGRNAQRSPAPAPAPARVVAPAPAPQATLPPPQTQAAAPAPAPLAAPPPARTASVAPTPAPAPSAAPAVAASQVAAPPPSRPTRTSTDDSTIVVPGQRETQVRPPNGDPRSNAERMEDIRAWDQCITASQAAFDSDPMSPQLDTPEDYCRRSLGMANRTSMPISRLERR